MSIEDEIAAVKAAAEKKLRLLRERERKQQRAVDARMLSLLRRQHADFAGKLEATAREQLGTETAQRSAIARASRASRPGVSEGSSDTDARYGNQDVESVL